MLNIGIRRTLGKKCGWSSICVRVVSTHIDQSNQAGTHLLFGVSMDARSPIRGPYGGG